MSTTDQDSTHQLVTYESDAQVGRIELNRPAESNAIDVATARALDAAIELATADDSVRVILVTGAGARFCAGGDLRAVMAADEQAGYLKELADTLDGALRKLASVQLPVVAGVQGAVAGAGLALMLSCDLVVAAPATKFVMAYGGVGLTPDCGISYLLPRAIGQQRALEMALVNRPVAAEVALSWGLITEIAEDASPADRARDLALKLAAGPGIAHGQARRLLRSGWEGSRAEVGAEEARTIARAMATPDAQTLVGAFASK